MLNRVLRAGLIVALVLVFVPAVAFAVSGNAVSHQAVLSLSDHAPAPAGHHGSWFVQACMAFSLLGLAGVVTITQVQPTNQPQCQDSYIANVSMDATDPTATIPHGLGVAPLKYYVTPTAQGAGLPFGTFVVTADATNITVTKSSAATMDCSFLAVAERPSSIGL
jgi:hypothetical protein